MDTKNTSREHGICDRASDAVTAVPTSSRQIVWKYRQHFEGMLANTKEHPRASTYEDYEGREDRLCASAGSSHLEGFVPGSGDQKVSVRTPAYLLMAYYDFSRSASNPDESQCPMKVQAIYVLP